MGPHELTPVKQAVYCTITSLRDPGVVIISGWDCGANSEKKYFNAKNWYLL